MSSRRRVEGRGQAGAKAISMTEAKLGSWYLGKSRKGKAPRMDKWSSMRQAAQPLNNPPSLVGMVGSEIHDRDLDHRCEGRGWACNMGSLHGK